MGIPYSYLFCKKKKIFRILLLGISIAQRVATLAITIVVAYLPGMVTCSFLLLLSILCFFKYEIFKNYFADFQ